MSEDKKNTDESIFSTDEIAEILDGFLGGSLRLCDLKGISHSQMEYIYSMGYNFYQTGRYDEAVKAFKCLCLFDHMNIKYWIALGAAHQLMKNYQEAVKAYGFAGMLDLENPKPPLHSAECYMAMGDKENALSALASLETNCPGKTALDKQYMAKGAVLKAVISAGN